VAIGLDGPSEWAGRHCLERAARANDPRMEHPAVHLSSGATIESPRSGGSAWCRHAVGKSIDMRRLMLATDLSSASERAADEAIRLAVENKAELVVFSVIDPGRLRLPGGVFLRRIDQERSRIDIGVQKLVRRAQAAGARATFLVWEGDPAELILAAAEAEKIDAIVLGSHRRGLLGRLVLGSVSTCVSEEARCQVLVVAG
jgi:nucleotide-binding universal stress UspA family protein